MTLLMFHRARRDQQCGGAGHRAVMLLLYFRAIDLLFYVYNIFFYKHRILPFYFVCM